MVDKKIYKARSVVSIGTKSGRIKFWVDSNKGSYYVTSDEAEQQVIENCVLFANGVIYLDRVEPETSVEAEVAQAEADGGNVEAEVAQANVYDEVTKCVDAIAVLRGLGVEGALSSKAKILEAAKAIGVEFPKL